MKDKVRAIVMLAISGICIFYGYSQRHEADVQRAEVKKLQQVEMELKKRVDSLSVELEKYKHESEIIPKEN